MPEHTVNRGREKDIVLTLVLPVCSSRRPHPTRKEDGQEKKRKFGAEEEGGEKKEKKST